MQIVMKGYNLDHFKKKDIYKWDEILAIIEEMEGEIVALQEKYERREQDIEDNFKRVSVASQVGWLYE